MELRQLKTFITIADNLSFTKTADTLGYAQSSVTTQIKLLEEDLGVKLFERLGRNVYLTSAGVRFCSYARQILSLTTEARDALLDGDELCGTIAIGSVESLCATRFPQIYKVFHERYPKVEVVIKISCTAKLRQWLHDNVTDVGFFIDTPSEDTELVRELEITEPMAVLASADHPLARKACVMPEDLSDEALILTEAGCSYRILFEQMLKTARVKPRSVLESGNIQSIKQLTMGGVGISFLPRMAVEEELSSGRLAALNWGGPEFLVNTQLVYHRDKWLTPIIKAFFQTTKEVLG